MSERVYVTALFRARRDRIDALKDVLTALAPPSRAEPGCIEYSFYQDADDPCVIIAIETWRDRAAIDAHLTLPHFKEAFGKLEGLLAAEPVIHKCGKII